jgi:hypothetical protein
LHPPDPTRALPMPFPMLADFALRLACGLTLLLLITPWRVVPPAFFRTHCLVILGLLVLASLDAATSSVGGPLMAAVVVAAVLSYLGAVAWGLGLVRVGLPVTVLVASIVAGALVAISYSPVAGFWALNAAVRLSSAFLLGSTLTAMLLGHHYLTAPAMSIEPLKRFVRCMAWGLGVRAVLAGVGVALWSGHLAPAASQAGGVSPLFLAVRWGMGFFGPGVATLMAWQTVKIRSTQSATGILYIATTLVLFGELSAMILSRDAGVVF